eukprot:NODE_11619_length_1275_cov_2.605401.p1 GENE.NODE_11619_length_1275_cov_2.605401~~NODE_11619_length_1275_cov_2.605401.p1  ORF type:complete len:265 (-),score=58.66 NODE_11619_length_1275_cov_2.605401:480-1181(-)
MAKQERIAVLLVSLLVCTTHAVNDPEGAAVEVDAEEEEEEALRRLFEDVDADDKVHKLRRAKLCYVKDVRWTAAYIETHEDSVEDCHIACRAAVHCRHFAYSPEGHCTMHKWGSQVDDGVDAKGYVSGARNCIFSSGPSADIQSSAGTVGMASSLAKWLLWLILLLAAGLIALLIVLAVVISKRSGKAKQGSRGLVSSEGMPMRFTIRTSTPRSRRYGCGGRATLVSLDGSRH